MPLPVPPALPNGPADAPVRVGTFWRAWAADGLTVVIQPFTRTSDGRVSPAGLLSMPADEWCDAFRPMLRRAAGHDPSVILDDLTGMRD